MKKIAMLVLVALCVCNLMSVASACGSEDCSHEEEYTVAQMNAVQPRGPACAGCGAPGEIVSGDKVFKEPCPIYSGCYHDHYIKGTYWSCSKCGRFLMEINLTQDFWMCTNNPHGSCPALP